MDFRIAPGLPNSGSTYNLSQAQVDQYRRQLASEGPAAGHQRGDEFLWFALKDFRTPQAAIVDQRNGRRYVLLCNQPHRVMLYERKPDDSLAWRIVSAAPSMQADGNASVDYTLDEPGARQFSTLLNRHDGGYFCAMLNDVAYSVIYITPGHSGLWRSGTILNAGTRQDAVALAAMIGRIR